jgi:hypothetical protein
VTNYEFNQVLQILVFRRNQVDAAIKALQALIDDGTIRLESTPSSGRDRP